MKSTDTAALMSLAHSLGFSLDFDSYEQRKRSNRAIADELTDRGIDLARVLATYPIDELTGLNSKNDLLRNGWIELNEADREGRHVTIVFCDVDNFKPLNTKYGEKRVDDMITAGGWAISQVLRAYDKAWRFGGDEFVFALKAKGLLNVSTLIRRIEKKWEQRLEDKSLPRETIRLSFGVFLINPEPRRSSEQTQEVFSAAVQEANMRMRRMKAERKATKQ